MRSPNYLRSGTVAPEMRARVSATGRAGGFLFPPGWWQRLQVALKAYGGVATDFEQIELTPVSPCSGLRTIRLLLLAALAENTQVCEVEYALVRARFAYPVHVWCSAGFFPAGERLRV